jgi:hypothetical protein
MGRRIVQMNALRMRLKERFDGAHEVLVIALGVRTCEGCICYASLAPPTEIGQMRVRT